MEILTLYLYGKDQVDPVHARTALVPIKQTLERAGFAVNWRGEGLRAKDDNGDEIIVEVRNV